MHDMGDWDQWWAVMWVGMIVMWTFLIAVIWAVFASLRGHQGRADSEELLARRYASGEIDVEEYRAVLDELRSRHTGIGRVLHGK